MKTVLSLHARHYPAMEARDYVKLLYQSEFGPGHLVAEGDALAGLQAELAQAAQEGYRPQRLCEDIGGGLCRLHLDPQLLTEGDLPLLARCFTLSARPRGSLAGLWGKLGTLSAMAWAGGLPLDARELELFLALYAADGCPPLHHSEGYRAAFTPHYRVLDRDLALYFPAFRAINAALLAGEGPVTVAVDGRCAAGKTTFAARCAQLFADCQVFHMDDFFLPPDMRTAERLATPGGNVDYERAERELFAPLSRGEAVALRAFDCSTNTMGEPVGIPCGRLNIVEGSYSLHPALAGYPQARIFFTCAPETQDGRLSRREGPEGVKRFREKWIPLEESYFQGLAIQDRCDVTVDTTPLSAGDGALWA